MLVQNSYARYLLFKSFVQRIPTPIFTFLVSQDPRRSNINLFLPFLFFYHPSLSENILLCVSTFFSLTFFICCLQNSPSLQCIDNFCIHFCFLYFLTSNIKIAPHNSVLFASFISLSIYFLYVCTVLFHFFFFFQDHFRSFCAAFCIVSIFILYSENVSFAYRTLYLLSLPFCLISDSSSSLFYRSTLVLLIQLFSFSVACTVKDFYIPVNINLPLFVAINYCKVVCTRSNLLFYCYCNFSLLL